MKISRFIQRFRMFLTLITVTVILSLLAGIIYLHNVGLPEFAKNFVQQELRKKKVHLDFDALKYKLNQGLVAEKITVFQTNLHEKELFISEQLVINLDKTKMLRGIFEIDKAEIVEANISIPLVKEMPDSPLINIKNIGGSFSLTSSGQLNTRHGISAEFEGIRVLFKGSLSQTPNDEKSPAPTEAEKQALIEKFKKLQKEIKKISWKSTTPPIITLETNGDLAHLDKLDIKFHCSADDISYNNATIEQLKVKGNYHRKLITLEQFQFKDHIGSANFTADLSLATHQGNFSLKSSIDFKKFIDEFSGSEFGKEVQFNGSNNITAEGKLTLPHTDINNVKHSFKAHLIGQAELRNVQYLEAKFNYLGTEFSWKNGSLFLDKLEAFHENGEFNGRLLVGKNEIKFSSNSSLPPQLFMPFLKGKGLERVLKQLKLTDDSRINIAANGTVNRNDITDWQAQGDIYMADISYRDTVISDASLDFVLTPKDSTYDNIAVTFDHRNWHKFQKFGGTPDGKVNVDKITLERNPDTGYTALNIKGAKANIWLTPVVKLFDRRTSKMFNTWDLQSSINVAKSDLFFYFKYPTSYLKGDININSFVMADLPISQTSLTLEIKPGETKITDIKTLFNYSNYPLEKQQAKPTNGALKVDQTLISFDKKTKEQTITITGIKGKVWPGLATGLFAKKAADSIEELSFTAPIESLHSTVHIVNQGETWKTFLDLDCGKLAYNKVNILSGKSKILIGKEETSFTDTTIDFDYRNYSQFKKFGGVKHGVASADLVTLNGSTTTVTNLNGIMWPGQIASMFSKDTAKTLHDLDFTSAIKSKKTDMVIDSSENWRTTASLDLGAFRYNKVPLYSAKLNMNLNEEKAQFDNISALFNYSNYSSKKRYGAPSSGRITANSVILHNKSNLAKIDSLKGDFYPAPAVRLFSSEVANELEEFRFKRPPYSSTSGTIDINNNSKRTNLKTSIQSRGSIVYNFLDEDVSITTAKANILTTSSTVEVKNITASLFDSTYNKTTKLHPLAGWLTYYHGYNQPYFEGGIAWNQLSIPAIGKTYKKEKQLDAGNLSGELKFTISPAGAKTFNGKGQFFIDKANLANLPIIGRLQAATSAYTIKNGVVSMDNLRAYSNTSRFSGKGTVNLDSERVDLRIKLSKLKRAARILNPARVLFSNFPVLDGAVKYKVYGQMDKIKVLPDVGTSLPGRSF